MGERQEKTLSQADPLLQPSPWKIDLTCDEFVHLHILLRKLVLPNEIHSFEHVFKIPGLSAIQVEI